MYSQCFAANFTIVPAVLVMSAIPDQVVNETRDGRHPFTIGDAETAPAALAVSGASSNTNLVPNATWYSAAAAATAPLP